MRSGFREVRSGFREVRGVVSLLLLGSGHYSILLPDSCHMNEMPVTWRWCPFLQEFAFIVHLKTYVTCLNLAV